MGLNKSLGTWIQEDWLTLIYKRDLWECTIGCGMYLKEVMCTITLLVCVHIGNLLKYVTQDYVNYTGEIKYIVISVGTCQAHRLLKK